MNFDAEILKRDHLKIIVADSGLGGLSVQALLDKELRKLRTDAAIEIIFYNSVAHHDYGYNTMPNEVEKLRVFDSALMGMLQFNPDLILIACNTLSVLYPKTKFCKTADVHVLGIIDLTIKFILENLNTNPEKNIILLGTETTINSNKHKGELLSKGISEEKIISQVCNLLESEIQINPESTKVRSLIEKYIDEVYKKIPNKNNDSLAVLCCTHYGYSKEIFQRILNEKFGREILVLNPNEKMAIEVVDGIKLNDRSNLNITNRVVSKVDIKEPEIETLGTHLAKDSPSVAQALRNYLYDEDLFTI